MLSYTLQERTASAVQPWSVPNMKNKADLSDGKILRSAVTHPTLLTNGIKLELVENENWHTKFFLSSVLKFKIQLSIFMEISKGKKKHEHLRSGRFHNTYNKRKKKSKQSSKYHPPFMDWIYIWVKSQQMTTAYSFNNLKTGFQTYVIFKLENLTQDACPLTATPGSRKNRFLCRGCIMLSNYKISLQCRY